MKLIKINDRVINLDLVICIMLEAPKPNYYPMSHEPQEAPIGVKVSFAAVDGQIGYIDGGCGQWEPAYLWFGGDEAAVLRRYIEDNCYVAC